MKIKKYTIMLFIFVCILIINTNVFADGFSIDGIFRQGQSFIENGSQNTVMDDGALSNIINPISGAFLTVGTFVIVGVGIYLGIKYVTSGVDDKANVKKQAYGVLVSAIVIFGAYGIWKLVYGIVSKF